MTGRSSAILAIFLVGAGVGGVGFTQGYRTGSNEVLSSWRQATAEAEKMAKAQEGDPGQFTAPIERGGNVKVSTNAPADWQPPRAFQRGILVGVEFGDHGVIDRDCGKSPDPRWETGACEFQNGVRRPLLVLPNPCTIGLDRYAEEVCHELGHANGWPGDHKGGYWARRPVGAPIPEAAMADPAAFCAGAMIAWRWFIETTGGEMPGGDLVVNNPSGPNISCSPKEEAK